MTKKCDVPLQATSFTQKSSAKSVKCVSLRLRRCCNYGAVATAAWRANVVARITFSQFIPSVHCLERTRCLDFGIVWTNGPCRRFFLGRKFGDNKKYMKSRPGWCEAREALWTDVCAIVSVNFRMLLESKARRLMNINFLSTEERWGFRLVSGTKLIYLFVRGSWKVWCIHFFWSRCFPSLPLMNGIDEKICRVFLDVGNIFQQFDLCSDRFWDQYFFLAN